MAITKFTESVNNIQNLSDNPNTSGMTAAELKAKFDKAGTDIKNYINDTLTEEVDTLNTTTSSSIGDLTELETTVQTDLVSAVNEVNNKLDDSGWITATLESGFSHAALASAGSLMYRKIGNIVYIKGSVSGFTSSRTSCTVLPEGYRPATRIDFYAAESSNQMAKFMVSAGGSIDYLGGTRGSVSSSQWFNLCTSFIVND